MLACLPHVHTQTSPRAHTCTCKSQLCHVMEASFSCYLKISFPQHHLDQSSSASVSHDAFHGFCISRSLLLMEGLKTTSVILNMQFQTHASGVYRTRSNQILISAITSWCLCDSPLTPPYLQLKLLRFHFRKRQDSNFGNFTDFMVSWEFAHQCFLPN